MALIIGGCPRSGTTLLRNLCHAHPDIAVTMEFRNFNNLGQPYERYARRLLKSWWLNDRHRSFLVQGSEERRLRFVLQSHGFVVRYLFAVHRNQRGPVDVATVEAALRSCFPTARVVGDKYPDYAFRLDELAGLDGLLCVIVYRDGRDVVSSILRMVHTDWRNRPFTKTLDTAEKAAKRWVHAIDLMERHADKLHIVRYEEFANKPEKGLKSLGDYLGVDPAGFPKEMIYDGSVGKHGSGLSDKELAAVMDIAGPTLARLGYI
jgi:hypothetical protein